MQQLPRDNPIVKGCIKAAAGHKIIAMDLTTAEVYVAAILAKDKALIEVFRAGGNFHSQIAKKVFKLPCEASEVADLYKMQRQAAKAVTFGIMYGAGANKISEQVTKDSGRPFSRHEAQEVIDDYFEEFFMLKQWIEDNQKFIQQNGFIYSYFGRKRRLPNVASTDKGIQSHSIRSGLNFLVQSAASDINLLGAIDMGSWIKANNKKARIFALVHDSILAEVPDGEIDEYMEQLTKFVQLDRGLSIPGVPVGCDFEIIHEDYSGGKFEKMYGNLSTFQIKEIVSHFNYLNLNLKTRPIFKSILEMDLTYRIIAETPELWYLTANDKRIAYFGKFLRYYLENNNEGIEFDEQTLNEIELGNRSYLFDSEWNFLSQSEEE
jgi:hypothetical protein